MRSVLWLVFFQLWISSSARCLNVFSSCPEANLGYIGHSRAQSGHLRYKSILASDFASSRYAQSNYSFIEQNCPVRAFSLPSNSSPVANDPLLENNVGLGFLHAERFWKLATGGPDVVVAVIDTGTDIFHQDLKDNLWVNKVEFSGQTGIDDDRNGFVDDVYGWSFSDSSADVTPGTTAGAEHGTHIAGIIGARGNNAIGTAGVAWQIKLMSLRVFDKNSSVAKSSDIANAVHYAVDNGARIINCSLGEKRPPTVAEASAFAYAEQHGVLVVGAAGNDSADAGSYIPGNISSVLTIGSIATQSTLSTFSNYGPQVSILAPGGDASSGFGVGTEEFIFSTLPNDRYGNLRGTSSAAPFVTGAAALMLSINPHMVAANLRKVLIDTSSPVSFRSNGVEFNYGLLNIEGAVTSVQNSCPGCNSSDSVNLNPGSIAHFGGGCSNTKVPNQTKESNDFGLVLVGFIQGFGLIFRKKRR